VPDNLVPDDTGISGTPVGLYRKGGIRASGREPAKSSDATTRAFGHSTWAV